MDLCILHIDQSDIGVPMDAVREVLIRPAINPVPLAPAFLAGITGFRGISLPVVEITPLLMSDASPTSPLDSSAALESRDRVVVCQQDGTMIGIRVDLLDRLSIPDASPTNQTSLHLLESIHLTDDSELKLLNLSQLLKTTTELMQPQLKHLS